jgi:hypothetical protein
MSDYYNYNDEINQAILDGANQDLFNEELEIRWTLLLIETWKEIREYMRFINYCELQTNAWILRQIALDTQSQINWKAQWKSHNSQPNPVRNDRWILDWKLAIYTRYVYREA